MKRLLLFFSSFVIATSSAAWMYLATSANHLALRAAFTSHDRHTRQIAVVNAVDFEKAHIRAIFGEADAQFRLGRFFTTGEMGSENKALAAHWFEKAAAQGNTEAQLMLARFSFLGEGTGKNDAAGAAWVKKAADGGSSRARALLGVLYLGGIGVAQNTTDAMQQLGQSGEKEAQMLYLQIKVQLDALSALPPEQKAEQEKAVFGAAQTDIRRSFMEMLDDAKKNDKVVIEGEKNGH